MLKIGDIFISDTWSVSQTFSQHTYGWKGVDYAIPMRTPLLACWDGVIESVQSISTGWGNNLRVKSSEDGRYVACYAHCDQLLKNNGDRVVCGELIAYSGTSGSSTGPHLHFTILFNGNPIDPASMPWDIKNLTQPVIGGEDMNTPETNEILYKTILGQPNGTVGDGGAVDNLNKPLEEVIKFMWNTQVAKDFQSWLSTVRDQFPKLQQSITDLTTKLDGQGKIIDDQEQKITDLQKELVSLSTKPPIVCPDPSQGLAEPSLSGILDQIKQLIKKWLS